MALLRRIVEGVLSLWIHPSSAISEIQMSVADRGIFKVMSSALARFSETNLSHQNGDGENEGIM